MRILVVGGAGYVGSHACKSLAHAGHEPVVFDNLSTGHAHAVKWGPLVRGDILDPSQLEAAFVAHKPDAVMHFAALAYVGESVQRPDLYYRTNVGGTLNLLDCMRKNSVGRLIFSSTCATYGQPDRMPITEATPQSPINPYGWSKLMAERAISDYCAAFGLGAVALRYFNAAGADPDGEIGEEHDPETHLIPLVLQAAAGMKESIRIFGSDYPTPDGSAIRDYVHVTDLAAAHVAAVGACVAGDLDVFNLGAEAGTSVLNIIERARRVTGRDIRAETAPRRPGDPPVLLADASKARTVLSWAPQYSGLDTILETAWAWTLTHRPEGVVS
ncbi:MAG: UDP-glucose 4-epimerase GalE [Hyphomonas sp.]